MSNQVFKFQYFPTKTYIDGKWVESNSKKTYDVFNPSNGEKLGNVALCDASDTKIAISAANAAFQTWKKWTAEQRSKILKNLVNVLSSFKKQLAEIITYENGKMLKEAQFEIELSIKSFEWYAEECKRVNGDLIPSSAPTKRILVMKQPIGVAALITPWNFPLYMVARKAAAALAAGCTVVIKPAEDTPYSALALCQLAEQAGLPSGCINVVTSNRVQADEIGKELCQNELIRKISFTGSTAVGRIIQQNCAGHIKKLQLELGGNAPFIVFHSADLDKAVNGLVATKFRCSGQTCICANRILVQEDIYDKFVEKLAESVKNGVVVGDGFNEKASMGPLINQRAIDKVSNLVEDSRAKGANILFGGKPHSLGGCFYEPTLITNITKEMAISREEIFGPVLALMKFKTEQEAIEIANSVPSGLGGYFYTESINQAWRVSENLQVGMVGVNESIISAVEFPFGGVKDSGFGYECSKYGIDEYIQLKAVCYGNLDA